MSTTRRGKIARLPLAIREELNRRLLENEPASRICAWVNKLPETKALIATFNDGNPAAPIDDRNISDWRQGGYADWLAKREKVERTKELAQYAVQHSQAKGGSIAEGGIAIASGQLLELLETADDASEHKLDVDALVSVVSALTGMRVTEQNDVRLAQNERKLGQRDQVIALEREKFKRLTCELFLKWYNDQRAKDVINAGGDNSAQIERLGQLMFQDDWKPLEGTATSVSDSNAKSS